MAEPVNRPGAADHTGDVNDNDVSKRSPVAALPSCSSPVVTTTAFLPSGKYQKRGSGLRARPTLRIMLASRRCCSSACAIATLPRSTQSGAVPPKKLSLEVTGATPSRSCPAQAGLPCRV